MRFVLDASVALAWYLPDESASDLSYALAVSGAIEREIAYAAVPLVWHTEIAGLLLRRLRAGRLAREAFDRALRTLDNMPLETHMNAYVLGILVERAERYRLQPVDAQYLDLAAVLGIPLATIDGGLRTAADAHGVKLLSP